MDAHRYQFWHYLDNIFKQDISALQWFWSDMDLVYKILSKDGCNWHLNSLFATKSRSWDNWPQPSKLLRYSSCVQGACPKWIPDARIYASPQQKPFSIFSLTTFLGGRSLVLTAVISIFTLWSISIYHQNNWLITVLAHVRSLPGNSIINPYLF